MARGCHHETAQIYKDADQKEEKTAKNKTDGADDTTGQFPMATSLNEDHSESLPHPPSPASSAGVLKTTLPPGAGARGQKLERQTGHFLCLCLSFIHSLILSSLPSFIQQTKQTATQTHY